MDNANVAPTFAGILMLFKHQTEDVSLGLMSRRLVNTVKYYPGLYHKILALLKPSDFSPESL